MSKKAKVLFTAAALCLSGCKEAWLPYPIVPSDSKIQSWDMASDVEQGRTMKPG